MASMEVGVSTSCFFPLETERAFQYLGENGIRVIEIFFNARCESRGRILQTILDMKNKYDVRISAIHPYFTFAEPNTVFGNYERRYQDGVDLYLELCEAAHALSCDLLIMHGDRLEYHSSEEEYIDRYCRLSEIIRAEGVRLSQENVVRFRSADPALLRKLRDALGESFYMTLDVKQAIRSHVDPFNLAREFGPHIVHTHISDHNQTHDCMLPGRGNFDFASFFSVLQQAGAQGDPIIELYSSAFQTHEELLQSHKFCEQVLSVITKS